MQTKRYGVYYDEVLVGESDTLMRAQDMVAKMYGINMGGDSGETVVIKNSAGNKISHYIVQPRSAMGTFPGVEGHGPSGF